MDNFFPRKVVEWCVRFSNLCLLAMAMVTRKILLSSRLRLEMGEMHEMLTQIVLPALLKACIFEKTVILRMGTVFRLAVF